MKLLLAILVILLLALFVPMLARRFARQRIDEAEWPFSAKRPLSRAEQTMYYRLVQSLPELVVLAQVPLASFLRVRKGRTWNEWFDRISRKSVDFLVCERDFRIVMAIELDDGGHDRPERVRSDKVKNRALTAAGVPLVRWSAHAPPDTGTIGRIVGEIRSNDDDHDTAAVARIEPRLHATHVEASNDPSIFHEDMS